jgi:hypothetical protein
MESELRFPGSAWPGLALQSRQASGYPLFCTVPLNIGRRIRGSE